MSQSNGPGANPNGWPSDYRPNEPVDPYQDPYYAQQPARPAHNPAHAQHPGNAQHPSQAQQPAPPARAPRIQTAAPSRVPQNGLPPNLGQQAQPQAPTYTQQYAQPSNQGYANPYGQPQQAAPQYAPPQYAQPPQQAYAPPPQQQPQAYAPQPVPRTQPPADPRYSAYPPGYDAPPTARTAQPPAQPPAYPPAYTPAPSPSAYVPETTQRPSQQAQRPQPQAPAAYDQWPTQPQRSQPPVDPQGYDLGNYLPASTPEPRTQRPTAPPSWPQQHAEPNHGAHGHPAQASVAHSQGFEPQFTTDPHATSQALEPVHDDEYDEHDEDYEEAPRKTRYGLIAASLIAAVAMGGGLAYAYKLYVAPHAQTANAPVIKNTSGPIKVKPSDPGGTKFANADSKMMEQLSGSGEAASDGGPKPVRTVEVGRDGSINGQPPTQPSAQVSQPASPAALPAAASVPGMMIEGMPPPRAPAPPAAAAPAVQQATRAAPKIIAAAPAAAAYPDDAAAAAAPIKKPVPKKVAVAAAGGAAAPAAVGGPKASNGFVAVLASVPASGSSRVAAMQQFADLQQKFGGVLGGKAPDVVEAKLPNGTFHRLVVGPPASRDSATGVCSQLKASGYTSDCWVTAF